MKPTQNEKILYPLSRDWQYWIQEHADALLSQQRTNKTTRYSCELGSTIHFQSSIVKSHLKCLLVYVALEQSTFGKLFSQEQNHFTWQTGFQLQDRF